MQPLLQLSFVHGLPSSHLAVTPPPHTPVVHFSPLVQASPSSHAALSSKFIVLHSAVIGLHTPVPQGESGHCLYVCDWQVPAGSPRHFQPVPQASLLQLTLTWPVPSCLQPLAGSHVSSVQMLSSEQSLVV